MSAGKIRLGDSDLPFESILVRCREFDPEENANLDSIMDCVLKDGPKAYKVATYLTIKDQHSGEIHHHALKIRTLDKEKNGWYLDENHSISLSDGDSNEIYKLFDFLISTNHVDAHGEYMFINLTNAEEAHLPELLEAMSSESRSDLLTKILSILDDSPNLIDEFVEIASRNPSKSKALAAALNISRFSDALEKLKELIAEDAPENEFQMLLQENPWMFGSEYSQLLNRRSFIQDVTT